MRYHEDERYRICWPRFGRDAGGRRTTLPVVPDWYPEEIRDLENLEISVALQEIDGLPGVVAVFTNLPQYVQVRLTP